MANFWKKQREALAHSQRKMAEILQVSNTTIWLWESDRAFPTLTVAELARGFEVTEHRIEQELTAHRRRMQANKEAVSRA